MRRRRSLQAPASEPKKLSALIDMMQIGLVVHEQGGIWVVHDTPFPDELDYVEYDADEKEINFIGKTGKIMKLGIPIRTEWEEGLENCTVLGAAYVTQTGEVKDIKMVTFNSKMIVEEPPEEEQLKRK